MPDSSVIGMPSRQKARLAFLSALFLLVVCGIGASVTIIRYLKSVQWATHSYDVQVALGDIQSSISSAARTRTSYLNSGDETVLAPYAAIKTSVHHDISRVRELTRDNAVQQSLCTQLEDNILRRLELLDATIEMRKSGPLDDRTQLRLSQQNLVAASDFNDIMQKMMDEEENLLGRRKQVSNSLLTVTLSILLAMFALAILLLWIHFRLLSTELAHREHAEENSRRLSVRVLQLQDEERRKFSRELHDSLGQLLAMAKMHMSVLLEKNPHDQLLAEIDKLITESVTETRTISHLLHPPLLDEIGIASAARWYADGFAKRSGIALASNIPEEVGRLPRDSELVLFRVLQESLTNIHRHSKSARAEISIESSPKNVVLRIRDFGQGMSRETLSNFLDSGTGTGVGVGLAGMRERVREQGGKFDIESSKSGTTVTVTMPVAPAERPGTELTSATS
jgi:signal transduction histidine kinase